MRNLRFSILALLVHLTLFFNIERLNLGSDNAVNIQTFTYILGIVAIVAVISLRSLWQSSVYVSIVGWLGVYGLYKFFTFDQRPLFGGIYTYILFTEMTLLVSGIWLAHHLARQLFDFEEAVANLTFIDSSRTVRRLNEALEDIQTEFIRSRRYKSPLSVVVVELETGSIQTALHRTVMEVQKAMMSRYMLTSLARLICSALRRTDMVIEQREQGRFIVLSPETSAENSAILVQRIQAAAAEHLGIDVKCGVASFPDSALTFDELVHQAENRIQRATDVEHIHTNGSGPTHSDEIDEVVELAPSGVES